MMRKVRTILLILLSIITMLMATKEVNAADITTNEVVTYMQSNNLFEDEEYFRLFGMILNGNSEYQIDSFKYTVTSNSSNITIEVTLNDKNTGEIKKTTTLTHTGNTISYTNPNPLNSLESRIDTVLLTELLYSIGGARGYDKKVLINWMNQIDLKNSISMDGIDSEVEELKYSYTLEGAKYNYKLDIPKNYTIRINEVTDTIPATDYVEIKEMKKSDSSITIRLFADGNLGSECELYRLNSQNKYEKIATVSCNNGEYIDENLKDNTEYTYQATIKNKIVCSDTRKIKTSEVPNTGASTSIIILVFITIIGIGLFILSQKYNPLKRV